MRSTRADASRRLAPWVALALPALALGTCATLVPPPDTGPAYVGAGAEGPTHGGVLRFWHESDLRSLDPGFAFDEISKVAVDLLFDPLLGYDAELRLVPELLEALPEVMDDEGRVLRLTLREGVRFHDGSPVRAEDVRFSLERVLDPELASPGASFYTSIEGADAYRAGEARRVRGIRVLDERRLEIRLARPDRTFWFALALGFASPVPAHAYSGGVDRTFDPIGSGAFVLDEVDPGVRVLLRRNEDYWRPGRPYLDGVSYELNLHRGPAFMRFLRGDVDVVHRQLPADFLTLRQEPRWGPHRRTFAFGDIWGLQMNCELAPFDDVHVRRAVAAALDREHFARTRNYQLAPLGQPVPPGLPGHDAELPSRQRFDLALAREEMRLAGYPDGLPEPVELWVGEGNVARIYGELTQAHLARIGIEVRIKQVSFSVYLQETRRRGTVAFFLGGWNPDYPDPSTFLDSQFHSRAIADVGSTNKSFYANPEVDALLDAARRELDDDRRRALYREASSLVARDAPWAFTFTSLYTHAWQPWVRGYDPVPVRGIHLRDVWLDLPRRRAPAREARR